MSMAMSTYINKTISQRMVENIPLSTIAYEITSGTKNLASSLSIAGHPIQYINPN